METLSLERHKQKSGPSLMGTNDKRSTNPTMRNLGETMSLFCLLTEYGERLLTRVWAPQSSYITSAWMTTSP